MPYTFVHVAEDAAVVLDRDLARLAELRDEGFVVRIATPHSPELDELESQGFETRPLPGRARWNLLGRASAYPILQGEFLTDAPTVVHGVGEPWAQIATYAARRAGVAAIIATIEEHDFSSPYRVRGYQKLGSWVDAYVVHHAAELESLLSLGVGQPRAFELLLGGSGIDLQRYTPDAEDLPPLRRPKGSRVVVGSRGSDSLTAVQRTVRRRHPGVAWTVVEEVGPGDLHGLDLFVSVEPTADELMAAAAMAVPVVATACPSTHTVVVDHETGRIATSGDTIAAVICEVLDDPKRMKDMGVRARARAVSRFARSDVDDQLLRLYDRVLRANR